MRCEPYGQPEHYDHINFLALVHVRRSDVVVALLKVRNGGYTQHADVRPGGSAYFSTGGERRTRAKPDPRRAAPPSESAASSREPAGVVTSAQAERALDATRDYWSIRDRGRFGSHPSHDDYDT